MILDDIVAHTRDVVAAARRETPLSALRERPGLAASRAAASARPSPRRRHRRSSRRSSARRRRAASSGPPSTRRPMRAATRRRARRRSRCSPSARWFQGGLEHLAAARAAVSLPLLRKDFLSTPTRWRRRARWGADAILVIAAAGEAALRAELLAAAREHGLDALVEVHDARELAWAASAAGDAGRRQQPRPRAPSSPASRPRSGWRRWFPPGRCWSPRAASTRRPTCGAWWTPARTRVLVGEAFMAAPDPGAALRELLACP